MGSIFIAKNACIVAGLTYCESTLITPNTNGPLGLSSYFGFTPLIYSLACFWTVGHGFTVVSTARDKYSKLAKADGEKDVDERYGLPNLYVQGTSKYARAFNCVQRSHQHIFETFTQAIVTSLIGAIQFPVSAAILSATYVVGRIALSTGYASSEGTPSKRYSSSLARLNWYGLLGSIFLGIVSSIKMIMSSSK